MLAVDLAPPEASRQDEQRAQRHGQPGEGEHQRLPFQRGHLEARVDHLVRPHARLGRGQRGDDVPEADGWPRQELEPARQVGMRGHRLQAQARQPPEHLDPDPPPPQRAVDEKLKHRQRHQRVPPARGGQMPVHRHQPSGERQAAENPDDDLAGRQRDAEQQHLGHDGIPVPHRLRDDAVESFLLVRDPAVGHELVDDEPGPLVQRRIGQQQQRDRDQQARVNAPVDDEGVSDHHARGQRRDQQRPPGHGHEHDARAQVVDPPVGPRPAEVPQQRAQRPAVDQGKTSCRGHREEHGAAAGAIARASGTLQRSPYTAPRRRRGAYSISSRSFALTTTWLPPGTSTSWKKE